MRKLILVAAACITGIVAYVAVAQVPNVAPSSFQGALRSVTGQRVTLTTSAGPIEGVVSSVNSDYVVVTATDKRLLSIPFTSLSYVARQPAGREAEIVLR